MTIFKKQNKGLFVLCYHGITDKEYLFNLSLGLQLHYNYFESHCKVLASKFTNCSTEEFFDSEISQTTKNAFYISFDDAYQNIIEYALPILEKYKIKFIIFPSTNYVDNDLFWWDRFRFSVLASPFGFYEFKNNRYFLKDLNDKFKFINMFEPDLAVMNLFERNKIVSYLWSKNLNYIESMFGKVLYQFKPITSASLLEVSKNPLCTIGSHGAEHLVMDFLDDDSIKSELQLSKNWLKQKVGLNVNSYCFPNGSTNVFSNHLATEMGYKYGYVIDDKLKLINSKNQNSKDKLIIINRLSVDCKNFVKFISKM